jgi:hypothetical protein
MSKCVYLSLHTPETRWYHQVQIYVHRSGLQRGEMVSYITNLYAFAIIESFQGNL